MGLTELPFPGFGGLNLRDGAGSGQPGDALDLRNAILLERGMVRSRPGSRELTAGQFIFGQPPTHISTSVINGVEYALAGGAVLFGFNLNTFASVGGSAAGPAGAPRAWSIAKVGTPAAEWVFAAAGDAGAVSPVTRFTGTAFDVPPNIVVDGVATASNLGTGRLLAVTPWDQRLLIAGWITGSTVGPGALAGDRAMIRASEPADPLSWRTDAFFRVGVGDGEDFTAMVAWRDMVFIFEPSTFWVLTGISGGAGGTPVFARRPVETRVGAVGARAVAAAPQGLYFIARDGVYRTTGAEPEKVSGAIDPLLTGLGRPIGGAGNLVLPSDRSLWELRYLGDSLLLLHIPLVAPLTKAIQLVYHLDQGWWSIWDVAATAWARSRDYMLFIDAGWVSGPSTLYGVWLLDPDVTYDFQPKPGPPASAGPAPFDCSWRSGWLDFGSPDMKLLHEMKLWLAADWVDARVYTDFSEAAPVTTRLRRRAGVVASSPSWPMLYRRSAYASQFSFEVAWKMGRPSFGVDAQGDLPNDERVSVHRVAHHLLSQAGPAATTRRAS